MATDNMYRNTYTHTAVLRPHLRDYPGEPAPEIFFWTSWCKGRQHRQMHQPPSSPIFTLDAPPAATVPLYPSLGQASNMLAYTPIGVVGNMYRKLHESFFRYAHEQTDRETHKHSDRNILHPACGQSNYIQQPLEFKCNLTASESYIIRQVTNKQSLRNAHSKYHSACKTLHIPVLRTINNVLSVTFSKCCLKSYGQR